YTEWRLRVAESIAGSLASGQTFAIRTRGGVVRSIGQWVEGEPALEVGQRSLGFLERSEAGGVVVVGPAPRQFRIRIDEQQLQRLVPVDAGVLVTPRSDAATSGPLARPMLSGQSLSDVAPGLVDGWRRGHER